MLLNFKKSFEIDHFCDKQFNALLFPQNKVIDNIFFYRENKERNYRTAANNEINLFVITSITNKIFFHQPINKSHLNSFPSKSKTVELLYRTTWN